MFEMVGGDDGMGGAGEGVGIGLGITVSGWTGGNTSIVAGGGDGGNSTTGGVAMGGTVGCTIGDWTTGGTDGIGSGVASGSGDATIGSGVASGDATIGNCGTGSRRDCPGGKVGDWRLAELSGTQALEKFPGPHTSIAEAGGAAAR
jgi:hypothetical protein